MPYPPLTPCFKRDGDHFIKLPRPNSQGIPRKYFPFIGEDYEQPLVAIKLNLNKSE